jgi:hypothetical protein
MAFALWLSEALKLLMDCKIAHNLFAWRSTQYIERDTFLLCYTQPSIMSIFWGGCWRAHSMVELRPTKICALKKSRNPGSSLLVDNNSHKKLAGLVYLTNNIVSLNWNVLFITFLPGISKNTTQTLSVEVKYYKDIISIKLLSLLRTTLAIVHNNVPNTYLWQI